MTDMSCQGRYDADGFTHKPLRRAPELTRQQMNNYTRFPLEICVDLLWPFPHSRLVIRKVWCKASTHRGHLVGDEVALLRQHVGHHERGQLRVRVRVDEPVVWQRVAEVARGVVLHQVERGGLGVVGWGDGGDFVVLVPGSVTPCRAAAPSSAAPGLACVALRGGQVEKSQTGSRIIGTGAKLSSVTLLLVMLSDHSKSCSGPAELSRS